MLGFYVHGVKRVLGGRPLKSGFVLRSLDLLGISARGSDAQPPQLEWDVADLVRRTKLDCPLAMGLMRFQHSFRWL